MKSRCLRVLIPSLFIYSLCLSSSQVQEEIDYARIIGKWNMEVNTEGEYYYLQMNIEKNEEGISGKISEESGFFTDVPLSNLNFDGDMLSFEFVAPTPPDGMERLLRGEFKVEEDRMEGKIFVEELGITVSGVATREE